MRLPQKRGFTLIELLVVISIIAVLSVMGMAV
ncbi:prepilin-type N-terminal cleavage/methylation domain-containing protein, partial [Patescibacteria group bacterium]|nr:prepilin-type N-terminal cleavage/methylation domain-containing protein [Patescibacteria group bacterium]